MKTSRYTNAERIHHQQTHSVRNVEGGHSGRRKMVPEENMDPQKGMKNMGNDGYIGLMDKVIFFYYLNLF